MIAQCKIIGRKSYLAGRRLDTKIRRLRTTRAPRKTNDVRVRRRTTEIGAAEGGVRGCLGWIGQERGGTGVYRSHNDGKGKQDAFSAG